MPRKPEDRIDAHERAEYQRAIEELTRYTSYMEKENTRAAMLIGKAETERDKLQAAFDAQHADELAAHKYACGILPADIARELPISIEQSLGHLARHVKDLSEDRDRMKQERDWQYEANAAFFERVGKAEDELDKLQEERYRLQGKITNLTADLRVVEWQRDQLKERVAALRDGCRELDQLKKDNAILESNWREAMNDAGRYGTEVAEFRSLNAHMTLQFGKELQQFQDSQEKWILERDKLQSNVKMFDEMNSNQAVTIRRLQTERDQLLTELAAMGRPVNNCPTRNDPPRIDFDNYHTEDPR